MAVDAWEIIVTLCLVALCVWYFCFYRVWVIHMNKFDGPPTNFLLGNALDLREKTDVIHVFHRWTRQYGGIVKIRVGVEYMLLITDYKFLEFLLSGNKVMNKSKVYTFLGRWLGTGLLTAGSIKWKKHRRIINPAFHVQVLEKFMDVFNGQTEKLVEKLSEEIGKDSFDMFPYITLASLDVICESSMGISINAQDKENVDYVKSVQTMCTIILLRSTSPIKSFDTLYQFSKLYEEEKKALKILHKVTRSVIENRRRELDSKNFDVENNSEGTKKKSAFLDLLIQSTVDGKPMSDEDIRQEVDTFMFAGHDTTAAAMGFAMYSLAQYADIQRKGFEEIKYIFQDDFYRRITYKDLSQMKYIENVIKETLRLYPSVPFYLRQPHENFEYDGKVIPRDIGILVMAYSIHRDEKYFPDPEKFDPARFDNMSNKYPYAYIPFSAGPRNCIGQKYAMMLMKVAITNVLRHYELLPAIPEHKLKISGETVMRAVNGIMIRLKKRTVQ